MYKCRRMKCEKKFTTSSNANRHEKKCEQGELVIVEKVKIFTCNNSWCVKTFTTKYNFERHTTKCTQKIQKHFVCSHCQKSFLNAFKT